MSEAHSYFLKFIWRAVEKETITKNKIQMKSEQLKKGNQIQQDIEYLKTYLFVNESCSKETRDDFAKWKEGRIEELKKQFNKL